MTGTETSERYICWQCHARFGDDLLQRCSQCGGVLEVISRPAFLSLERRRNDIWDFADGLPVQRADNYITLGEGWIPCYRLQSWPKRGE